MTEWPNDRQIGIKIRDLAIPYVFKIFVLLVVSTRILNIARP